MKARRTVLVALGIAQHSYYRGVARYAAEHGWHLVPDMMYTGQVPLGWKGDGIISFMGYREDLVRFIRAARVPRVELTLVRDDVCPGIPRVEGDNETIGRLAARHFLERGFRHVAWAPFQDDTINGERLRGLAGELARRGLPCRTLPTARALHGPRAQEPWARRRAALLRELRRLPRPLAIFAYNDCVAADLVHACQEARLLVPEEVAVLGVDNDPFICECVTVPLSSVLHDLEGMAYAGAALLDRLMRGATPPSRVVRVPPRGIVKRKSTDILAVEDVKVSKTLRHIWDRYPDPLLQVGDLVKAAETSRRTLERAFRRHLGRSLHDEIRRVRLDRVKAMLTETRESVTAIAAATGFTRPAHLFRLFRQATGTSPRTFRRRKARG